MQVSVQIQGIGRRFKKLPKTFFGALLMAMALATFDQNSAQADITINTPDFFNCPDSYSRSAELNFVASVNDLKLFESDNEVKKLLDSAFAYVQAHCPNFSDKNGVGIIVYPPKGGPISTQFRASYTDSVEHPGQFSWAEIWNNIAPAMINWEQREAQQKAQDAAAADQKKQKDDIEKKFISDFGVQSWANQQTLLANPFPFKDKVVGLYVEFQGMLSQSEASFGQLVVSDIPTTLFTTPGQQGVLAIRVNGLKPTNIMGAQVNLPYGSYVGVYFCKQPQCAEF